MRMENTLLIQQLKAVHFVFEDVNKDIIWKLSFPSISEKRRNYLRYKILADFDNSNHFDFYHYDDRWFYGLCFAFKSFDENYDHLKKCVLFLESVDFNPEKYKMLTSLLCNCLVNHLDVKILIRLYLTAITENRCVYGNKAFNLEDFEPLKIMSSKCRFKQIINMFGVDIILIYTALILKQRIAVYHHRKDNLLQFVATLPCFVWHRRNWDEILYPLVDINCKDDIQEISGRSHFVAGFTNSEIETKTDFYDLFVNLAAVEITIANQAKDVFAMTKTHKEIAMFMKRLAENDSTNDFEINKEISSKTKELIANLKSLGCSLSKSDELEEDCISIAALEEKKLGSSLESFLKRLAVAEDFKLI